VHYSPSTDALFATPIFTFVMRQDMNGQPEQTDIAAEQAESAAKEAEIAAASATSAAVAQGQLIGAVMEASREDAARQADRAESAAREAASAEESTKNIFDAALAEIKALVDGLSDRLTALENKPEPAPVVQSEMSVQEISAEGAGVSSEPPEQKSYRKESSPRKRHGRRR
jgi:hypothetical protein